MPGAPKVEESIDGCPVAPGMKVVGDEPADVLSERNP
jgi:hypothetical protein